MSSERLRVLVPMRWGDMDAYGHINNVQIVRMLEEARIAAFGPPGGTGAAGVEPLVPLFSAVPDGTLALVVEHRVRYVRPLDYRNVPAEVDVWVSGLKAAALTLDYLVHDPVDGHQCVRATTQLAFVEEATGRLLRLTEDQRRRLEPYVGAGLFR
ncbi:thioesterase family protein [Sinomonas atrocyanea]|uniref:acyl-CoA thioesterase n=1 Tax=Sinomonas atrocyanea TaxID=37927 RepID=UPI002782D36E|nr:thioesterase family protein [Sinomonas atrocyanea]MDQ0260346.1 acyl-CoA thioester hydrolase [Sinomonas atrocyanea]MDR6622426.1 acyl-CoA thioester hydrolase [Sinomonas atrocyanea]